MVTVRGEGQCCSWTGQVQELHMCVEQDQLIVWRCAAIFQDDNSRKSGLEIMTHHFNVIFWRVQT